MSDQLPKSWRAAPLNTLCEKFRGVSYGRNDASAIPKKDYVAILRANNIQNDRLTFEDLVWVPSDCVSNLQKLRKGDIVVAMSSGSKSIVGKTAQLTNEWAGSFGAFCGVLRANPELNSRYVGMFLRTREYRNAISELAAGSNINNLKNEHLAEIQVPVAPLGEQRRIVVKIEKLLAKVDTCRQRLEKTRPLLKRFRQSILASACSGRLTVDWRMQNRDVESSQQLIRRIFEDRNKRFKELCDKCAAAGTKSPKRPKNLARQKITRDDVPELPETWEIVCWDDLADWITYGFTRPMPHVPSGIPIVTAKNVRDGFLDWSQPEFTTAEAFAELSEKDKPRRNEILVTKDGAIRGRAALVETDAPFCISQSVAVVRFGGVTAYEPYLLSVVRSKFTQNLIEQESMGTAIPHISITNFGKFPVPLPPMAEQQEIVRRVNSLFELADQLELRLTQAGAQVDKLTPSILSRAFAGKLVPQDPNDEPASELLKRITSAKMEPNKTSIG